MTDEHTPYLTLLTWTYFVPEDCEEWTHEDWAEWWDYDGPEERPNQKFGERYRPRPFWPQLRRVK